MRETSKALYLVSGILNIICVFVLIVLATIIGSNSNNKEFLDEIIKSSTTINTYEEAKTFIGVFIFFMVVFIIAYMVETCLIYVARKNLVNNSSSIAIHIVMIVLASISGNIFLLIASIFGVAAIAEDNKKNNIE